MSDDFEIESALFEAPLEALKDQKEKEEFYGIQHLLQNENSKAKAYGS